MSEVPELKTVVLSRNGGITTITLNRPEVLNSFNDDLGHDLIKALKFVDTDTETRCIILTGAGRAFSAGEDLKARLENPKPLGDTLRNRYHPAIRKLRSIGKPIIAKINGVAAGAGLSIALACDVRIAVDSAKFGMAFVKISVVPDSGAFWFVPRLIGFARAYEWFVTGDTLSAPKALEWGLINQVVPADQLDSAVENWAKPFASGPTAAYALIKRGLNAGLEQTLEESLELEAFLQELAGSLEDHHEGVTAFIEKRAPNFTGK